MEIDLDEPSRPQIAAVLGCSSRWIGELRAQGEMPAEGASMPENVEAWVARHTPKHGDGDAEVFDKEQEQARLAKEQADAKAMDNAERRRELASLPDIQVFAGELDFATLHVGKQTRTVEWRCVSALEAFHDQEIGARLSDAWHRLVWPNEEGCANMTGIEKTSYWGVEKPPSNVAVVGGSTRASFLGNIGL